MTEDERRHAARDADAGGGGADPGGSGGDIGGAGADTGDAGDDPDPETVDDVPTIGCARCGHEWRLDVELEDLQVGNQAVEQFALDHRRHTGHFPDDVSTWRATCRRCPETAERLDERAARRWARTHARHARHAVAIDHASLASPAVVEPESD